MDARIAQHILKIEDGKENQAVKVFRETSDRHKAMLAKQQEFEEYRNEYDRQIRELGRSGTSIDSDVLVNYHQFKGALDKVIDQHSGMIDQSSNAVEDSRSAWSASHQRRQALEQLIDNKSRESRVAREKSEQKLLDDIGIRSQAH